MSQSTNPIIWKATGHFLKMGRILFGKHPQEYNITFMNDEGIQSKNAQQIACDYHRSVFLGSQGELSILEQVWNVDKYNIYLISVAEDQELSSLTIPGEQLPVLVKKGNLVYVYGRNADGIIGYSPPISLQQLIQPFPFLQFPESHLEQKVISRDLIPISFYKMLTETGHHFDVDQKFGLYMQGEMTGNAISENFFRGLINQVKLPPQTQSISFGYINDKGEICGFSLIFERDRPDLWVIGIMENANNPDPKLRKQTLIYSGNLDNMLTQALPQLGSNPLFCEVLNKSNFTRVINIQHEITSAVASKKMMSMLVNVINPANGRVNIELAMQVFAHVMGSGRYDFYNDLLANAISENKWERIKPELLTKLGEYQRLLEGLIRRNNDIDDDNYNRFFKKKLTIVKSLKSLCNTTDNGVGFFQYFFESGQFLLQEQDAKKRIGNFILEILSWLTSPLGGAHIYKATFGFWPRFVPSIHDRDYGLANKTDKELTQILARGLAF